MCAYIEYILIALPIILYLFFGKGGVNVCILLYDIPYHTGRRTNAYSVFNINHTFLRDNYQKISILTKLVPVRKE